MTVTPGLGVPPEAIALVKSALCKKHSDYDELCEDCVRAVLAAFLNAVQPRHERALEAALREAGARPLTRAERKRRQTDTYQKARDAYAVEWGKG